jgi:GTP-binding protein
MLIDATLPVSEPDKKLARYIADQMKPVIIVMNKWDLAMAKARQDRPEADDTTLMEEYGKYLDDLLVNLDFAPVAFVTAKDSKNVQIVLDTAQRLFKEANTRLTTGQLNRVVRKILQEKLPSTPSGRKARIYYATQASVAPPTIVLFVNNPKFLDQTYQRFMVNRLREELPFGEIPIQLIIRGRPGRSLPKSLDEATDKDLEETPQEPEPKPKRKTKPLRGARR